MLSIDEIARRITYNPDTGKFSTSKRIDVDGTMAKSGYFVFNISGRVYYAHRIAFALMYGRWPENDIDHINGMKTDNRLGNLREATRQQNLRNKKCMSQFGYKGVARHRDENRKKRFSASIRTEGKNKFLGWFATPEEAWVAYKDAAIKQNGEFARF